RPTEHGQKVSCAHILTVRLNRLPGKRIGVSELESGLAGASVLLDGIAVLDDGLGVFLLRDIFVAAGDITAAGGLRVFRARGEERYTENQDIRESGHDEPFFGIRRQGREQTPLRGG